MTQDDAENGLILLDTFVPNGNLDGPARIGEGAIKTAALQLGRNDLIAVHEQPGATLEPRFASALQMHWRLLLGSASVVLLLGLILFASLPRTWTATLDIRSPARLAGGSEQVGGGFAERLRAFAAGRKRVRVEGTGPVASLSVTASDRTAASSSAVGLAQGFAAREERRARLPAATPAGAPHREMAPPRPALTIAPPAGLARIARARAGLHAEIAGLAQEIAREKGTRGAGTGANTSELNLASAEVARARSNVAELGQRYGPKHPALINAEMALADADLHAAAIKGSSADEQTANAATAWRIAALHRRIRRARRADLALARQQAEAGRLAGTAGEQRAVALPPVRPQGVASPMPAVSWSRPVLRSARIVPFGTVAGLTLVAAAMVVAFLLLVLEARDTGFRTGAAAGRSLHLPLAGVIPDLDVGGKASGLASGGAVQGVPFDPNSAFEHAVRQALVAIGGERGGHTAVAVCSAVAAEGKTTLAINLARAAAMGGRRVVLVDCDGRMRATSKALTSPVPEAGLVEVLRGHARLDDALRREARSGAWVVPYSAADRADYELFSSPEPMKRLLLALRERFDLVLLDTAPVLALVEARTLAELADRVLLVVRWRKTPSGASLFALKLLREAGASVVGFALTRVQLRKPRPAAFR